MIQSVSLGSLCDIQSGGTPSRKTKSFFGGDIPWVKIGDLERSNGVVFETEETITDAGLKAIGGRIFPVGTLLFAIYGSIGKMAFATKDMSCNQAILGIQNRSKHILDDRFLFHLLRSRQGFFLSDGQGIAQKNLSAGYLRSFEFPLPPLSEQKRIAAILDKADQLRQKRKQVITLLDSLTQSIFLEMFGELSSQAWHSAKISEVALNIRTGPFGSQLLHSEFVDEGIAVLGIDNAVSNRFEWGKARFISKKKYRELLRYTVKPNDVLITIMGTCGRCVVVPKDIPTAINTKHLCCITLNQNKILPEYLHACFLNNRSVLRQLGVQTKGAVMPGLNMGIIKSLVIPIPPISLQECFRDVLAKAVKQIRFSKKAANHAELLFASLQHRAFSGQL